MLDPFLTGFYLFAHENGENLVRTAGILQRDAAQGALFGVHGGLPQFVGVHLTEALEAGDPVLLRRKRRSRTIRKINFLKKKKIVTNDIASQSGYL